MATEANRDAKEFKPDGVTVTDMDYYHIQDEVVCGYCFTEFCNTDPGYAVNLVRRERGGVFSYDEGVWHRNCIELANMAHGYGA